MDLNLILEENEEAGQGCFRVKPLSCVNRAPGWIFDTKLSHTTHTFRYSELVFTDPKIPGMVENNEFRNVSILYN